MSSKTLSLAAPAVLLAAFLAGCPPDPVCPDCRLTGGDPCGSLTLSLTVPARRAPITGPKLSVSWTRPSGGAAQQSSMAIGAPLTSEPWQANQKITVKLTPADLAELCEIPANGPAPYGAWTTAEVTIAGTGPGGAGVVLPVQVELGGR